MKKVRFFLVGPGRVGTTLGAAWVRAGHRCVGVEGGRPHARSRARHLLMPGGSRRQAPSGTAAFDLLLLATPDRVVDQQARSWAGRVSWRGRVVLHTSGVLPASVLEPLRRRGASAASLHPLSSLARADLRREALRGTYFGIEGDGLAVRWARRLTADVGGRVVAIRKGQKALYHLSACLSSGYLLGLIEGAAFSLAPGAADPRRLRPALLALADSTLRNARKMGPGKALTGPLLRGDSATIKAHLRSLKSKPRAWRVLHRLLAGQSLSLARRTGRLSAAQAGRLGRLLGKAVAD